MGRIHLTLFFAALILSCAPRLRTKQIVPLFSVTQSLDAFGEDFVLQQKMTAHFKGRVVSFTAVLQKQADRLTILGLTPMGTRAFLLEKTDQVLNFKNFIHQKLPFPPEFMLLDIQSIFSIGEAQTDGVHQYKIDATEFLDHWTAGKLLRREIRFQYQGREAINIIDYQEGYRQNEPPPHIVLKNGPFNYKLEIENKSYRTLPAKSS